MNTFLAPSEEKSAAASSTRFTLDGSDELEGHLAGVCVDVLDAIRQVIPEQRLEALMLGGGYGRGEGGVLETSGGQQPYNDLEFYVFVRGNRWLNQRRYSNALHELGHKLAVTAGIEIEFKITSFATLRRSAPSMFYYDLFSGHKWLWGDRGRLLECAKQHHFASLIPMAEATRLLMNRNTGLLFASEKLKHQPFTADDADFVGRNLAKVQLALGDAVLTVFGQYHWSCRERHARLLKLDREKLTFLPEVQGHHAEGVEFKLRPHRTVASLVDLQRRYDELAALNLKLWLWLESRRLGRQFISARDYALHPADKCPETNPWRNFLVNAKTFGPVANWRYPRERLLNSLSILLWSGPMLDAELTLLLQKQLRTTSTTHRHFLEAYQVLSARLNGSSTAPL